MVPMLMKGDADARAARTERYATFMMAVGDGLGDKRNRNKESPDDPKRTKTADEEEQRVVEMAEGGEVGWGDEDDGTALSLWRSQLKLAWYHPIARSHRLNADDLPLWCLERR